MAINMCCCARVILVERVAWLMVHLLILVGRLAWIMGAVFIRVGRLAWMHF